MRCEFCNADPAWAAPGDCCRAAQLRRERDQARAEAAEYKGSFQAVDGVLALFFDRPDDREAEDIAAYIRRERAELRGLLAEVVEVAWENTIGETRVIPGDLFERIRRACSPSDEVTNL